MTEAGKHWRAMATPRISGRSAFLQGADMRDNPYEMESICHRKWQTGFRVAAKKAGAA